MTITTVLFLVLVQFQRIERLLVLLLENSENQTVASTAIPGGFTIADITAISLFIVTITCTLTFYCC